MSAKEKSHIYLDVRGTFKADGEKRVRRQAIVWFHYQGKGGGWYDVRAVELDRQTGKMLQTLREEAVQGKLAARKRMYAWFDELGVQTGAKCVYGRRASDGTVRWSMAEQWFLPDMEKSALESALYDGLDKTRIIQAVEEAFGAQWTPWERNSAARLVARMVKTIRDAIRAGIDPLEKRQYDVYDTKRIAECLGA